MDRSRDSEAVPETRGAAVYRQRQILIDTALQRWLGGSVVERRSLIGELSLVCTGPAADG